MPTIRLQKLTPIQHEIMSHPARFKVVAGGRRLGKTVLAANLVIHGCLIEGTRNRQRPEPFGIFAPTYKYLDELWNHLIGILAPITLSSNKTERIIKLVTGATIEGWSMDKPDAGRSRHYRRIIIDEASLEPNLESIWQNGLMPTLADLRGDAIFFGSPKGMNFFFQLYQRGLGGHSDWHSWQVPTAMNPHIDPIEIENARRELPERVFRQEYLAEFLTDSGVVFRGVQDISTLSPHPPIRLHDYVMGIDFARHNDFTVISVLDANTREQVYLDRFNQINWTVQRGRILEVARRYQPRLILAESNSIGEPNIEELTKAGIKIEGFQTTAHSKPAIIDQLTLAIERGDLCLLNDRTQIHELSSYTMSRTASGNYQYSAPVGGHDDTVIALALAFEAVNRRPPRPIQNARRSMERVY